MCRSDHQDPLSKGEQRCLSLLLGLKVGLICLFHLTRWGRLLSHIFYRGKATLCLICVVWGDTGPSGESEPSPGPGPGTSGLVTSITFSPLVLGGPPPYVGWLEELISQGSSGSAAVLSQTVCPQQAGGKPSAMSWGISRAQDGLPPSSQHTLAHFPHTQPGAIVYSGN